MTIRERELLINSINEQLVECTDLELLYLIHNLLQGEK